ncbi:MAG: ACP S-malonyltransferase [Phycisphaerae bacterium]|nr:ACP S-malonyltransferase [Phycisphaerae bacterium]
MGKIAVIFPGQGAQSVGMGRDFAEVSRRAAEVFARANDILGFDIRQYCFEGPPEQLERTDIQQPAIFVTGIAIWEALLEKGLSPECFSVSAGLSLGEYTALCAAGSMEFDAALRLVHRRGQLMQQAALASPGSMVSLIGGDKEGAVKLCEKASQGEVLSPANFNCPGQIVISGVKSACQRAVEMAGEFDCRAIPLKVSGAFHSALMQSAADQLGEVLRDTTVHMPRVPIIANVTAEPHTDPDGIRKLLQDQVVRSVRWQESMERLIEQGVEMFFEIGPGRVLTGLMRKINRKVPTVNVSTVDHIEAALGKVLAESG